MLGGMARWQPNARERLEKAAMELFQERGYVETTVQDIAGRAGLTERTFFRYFADKREVLFSGSADIQRVIVAGIESAGEQSAALDIVVRALQAAAAFLQERRDPKSARARYALVTKHAELQERELIKLAGLAAAVTKALHARGITDPTASLAAETGMALFKVGFERWISGRKPHDFTAHIDAAFETLRAITSGAPNAGAPERPPANRAERASMKTRRKATA